MKKSVFAAFIVCVVLASGTAFAGDIKSVRIGTEGAYPPFNLIDKNGELQGFDVDIAKALCKAADVTCTFVIQDWDGMIPGLLAKKYDAIIASMAITDERKKKVAFTNKYYMTPAKFVAQKGAGFDISKEGLKGKTIGVQRATTHENFVRDNYGDSVTIKSYATQDEANMDLVSGRVDLVIADSVVLQEGFLNTDAGKDYEFTGPGFTDAEWYGDGIGIAIRKGDKELVTLFNDAIDKIRADGTYKAINDKYFDFDVYGD
ncbi:ABC transporter substrate-binding protein [Desulfopila inferna]|uniref:ABC transporter substrate-binding protein n=1 Tax=Desulfopila inferna TaxID=468528 RepID=UPI00196662F7|nr:ABC transporter substrate-binding protein [Desulfopila inferna]MBM9606719.1 ABC transporter substrate-binding protein [Desulfopila inferna]